MTMVEMRFFFSHYFTCSWVAPNIYYLGYSGVVNFSGIRIAGFSGIYDPDDFKRGHYEIPPYKNNSKISLFHVRQYELWKLYHLRTPVDIILSHDWPSVAISEGDTTVLYKQRPSLEGQNFGINVYSSLLKHIKPSYWFSGHMHVNFESTIPHGKDQETKFMALDKAMQGRPFINFIEMKSSSHCRSLCYDLPWLAITRLCLEHFPIHMENISDIPRKFFSNEEIDREINFLKRKMEIPEDCDSEAQLHEQKLLISDNFLSRRFAGSFRSRHEKEVGIESEIHPETEQFIQFVNISEKWREIVESRNTRNP
eukprot:TRINITY_DN6124_c0_g1_i1.p1 TRINITY_DN6124_c0_g1~~TRINITY_DN6124_c0_g1_i1.p1  ORF type:complete len:311 (-),score=38.79 TRINITY_DN6124_c0_g1_i1:83-1015(-)